MHARLRSPAARAAAAAAATSIGLVAAASGAAASSSEAELRRHQAALQQRATTAAVELYALETQVVAARRAAAVAAQRVAALEAEQTRVEKRFVRVQRDSQLAEGMLADRLRALYESGDVHPLAVFLGAASLDDALVGLDGLQFAAEQDRKIVRQTRSARRTLHEARRALTERRARAAAAAEAAAVEATAFERAHAERAAYVQRLIAEQRLTDARVAALEQQAQAATERADALAPPATRTRPVADTQPAAPGASGGSAAAGPAQGQAPAAGGRTLTVEATAYTLPGRTATGLPVGPGVVAVDPAVIPLGTRMTIPGYGEGVAADVGAAVRGNKIDVWVPTRAEALQWGRRTITITLH